MVPPTYQSLAAMDSRPGRVGGPCTPIGMPTNVYHGGTEEMLRRQPAANSVQTSPTHPTTYMMTALAIHIGREQLVPAQQRVQGRASAKRNQCEKGIQTGTIL